MPESSLGRVVFPLGLGLMRRHIKHRKWDHKRSLYISIQYTVIHLPSLRASAAWHRIYRPSHSLGTCIQYKCSTDTEQSTTGQNIDSRESPGEHSPAGKWHIWKLAELPTLPTSPLSFALSVYVNSKSLQTSAPTPVCHYLNLLTVQMRPHCNISGNVYLICHYYVD